MKCKHYLHNLVDVEARIHVCRVAFIEQEVTWACVRRMVRFATTFTEKKNESSLR